jgi:hypothetical protein
MWLADDYEFKPGMLADPVIWMAPTRIPDVPSVSDAVMERQFPKKNTWPFQGWGHDEKGVHYIATRDGLKLHLDISSPRYSHQIVLRNDGWNLDGRDRMERPVLHVGSFYCLDTHSPHRVIPDPRIGNGGRYFAAIVFDRPEPVNELAAWEILSARVWNPVP